MMQEGRINIFADSKQLKQAGRTGGDDTTEIIFDYLPEWVECIGTRDANYLEICP